MRTHPKHLNELERAGDIHCPDARYGCKHVGIRNKEGEEDFILLIRVQYRSDKLVETVRGEAWVRHGESKRKLTEDEKREIRIAKR
jgi:ATP-dependent DNA helicase RecG